MRSLYDTKVPQYVFIYIFCNDVTDAGHQIAVLETALQEVASNGFLSLQVPTDIDVFLEEAPSLFSWTCSNYFLPLLLPC